MGNDRVGLVFKRETTNSHYLSIDDCTEFKIPNRYDSKQHQILNNHIDNRRMNDKDSSISTIVCVIGFILLEKSVSYKNDE